MKISADKNGFRIYNRLNRLILEHSPASPLIKAGTATPVVKSRSGFYSVAEKKRQLSDFSIFNIVSREESRIMVSIEDKASNSMKLLITEQFNGIKIEFTDPPGQFNRLVLRLPAEGGRYIFGCGEQYTGKNLKGRRVPLWVSEPGVGRRADLFTLIIAAATRHIPRWYNTYFPSPVWVSSNGNWFKSSSKAYTEFDFTAPNHYELLFWEVPVSVELGAEQSIADAVAALSKSSGRQPKLPEWAYDGLWLGAQGGSKKVEQRLEDLSQKGVRISALWCQDWEGRRQTSFGSQLKWVWESDPELYPGLPEFILGLRRRGVRFLGYNNTFLTPGSSMFEDARENGYLVKNPDGTPSMVDVPFDPAALVDFTNKEAKEWLKSIIKKNMIETGLSGWMADFGEMIQHDVVLESGESGLSYHNNYPADWARLNREAAVESGLEDELIYFMRSGFEGSAEYTPLYWTGDQLVDWSKSDGLPSAIAATISMGMSGIGYVHSDIGGYTSLAWKKRSEELLMRWTEFSAFTQVMRSHEGNRPLKNVQFGFSEHQIKHLARMTEIFCSLKPLHRRLSSEYQSSGLPPVRHVALHYPEPIFFSDKYRYQYLYGRDLLVCPVISPRKKEWACRLPDDKWIHIWSGEVFEGGRTVKVDAPLGYPPVFYRYNSDMNELYQKLKKIN